MVAVELLLVDGGVLNVAVMAPCGVKELVLVLPQRQRQQAKQRAGGAAENWEPTWRR